MENREERKPIVSIIVVTYNSSEFVIDTLESAKAQTYNNLELVITDDGSADDTVKLCKNWIAENKSRFVNTVVCKVKQNTGIVPNVNRGFQSASGEWIKFIAGDDVLTENCITDFVDYCLANKTCEIVFGRMFTMNKFGLTKNDQSKIETAPFREQKKLVYLGSGLPAPGLFIKYSLLKKLGGFDSRYTFVEDLPLYIKVVNRNIRLYFIDKYVVKYRIHNDNICLNNNKSHFFNKRFYADNEKIILRELMPYYFKRLYLGHILHNLNYIIISRFILLFGNRNNFISRTLNLFVIKNTFRRARLFLQKKYALFL